MDAPLSLFCPDILTQGPLLEVLQRGTCATKVEKFAIKALRSHLKTVDCKNMNTTLRAHFTTLDSKVDEIYRKTKTVKIETSEDFVYSFMNSLDNCKSLEEIPFEQYIDLYIQLHQQKLTNMTEKLVYCMQSKLVSHREGWKILGEKILKKDPIIVIPFHIMDIHFDEVVKSTVFARYNEAQKRNPKNPELAYNIALCHYIGFGTQRNEILAFECFKNADELGHWDAKNKLSLF